MDIFSVVLIVAGLILFETVSSIDNAVINAQVLSTMSERARRWFLIWGLLIAVFLLRGLLPFAIVWITNPSLGPVGVVTAAFSSDPRVQEAVELSAPILLIGGGTFLIFLFFHWLFLEPKKFGLRGERFIQSLGVWFYAIVSIILAAIVWFANRDRLFTGKEIRDGKSIVGLKENGFRSNGLSLVRRIMREHHGDNWHELLGVGLKAGIQKK